MKLDLNQTCQDLTQKIVIILKQAQQKGASSAQVIANLETGLSATVRKQVVDLIEFQRDKSIHISVFFGQQKGSVSITDLSDAAIENAVQAACHIAQYTEVDPAHGLPEKETLASDPLDLDLAHPWDPEPEEVIEKAKRCEAYGLEYDANIVNSEGAYVTTHTHIGVLGNSHGFLERYPATFHSMGCTLLAKSKNQMQREHDYTVGRALTDLVSEKAIGQSSAQRTLARLGARKIKTQKSPVIFSAQVARSLWGHFLTAISGRNLYRKRSFLLDHLDRLVLPSFVSLSEDPHLLKGLGSAPFDLEGVQTQPQTFVKAGILKKYILSTYSARKLGLKSTGNAGGVRNVSMTSNSKGGLDPLLKKMGRGLLVTELIGHGVNIVTGDYSRGAFGFWVEDGEIQYPVEEITIAGQLKDLFSNLVAIGDDLDLRGNVRTGSVLLEEMTIAGH